MNSLEELRANLGMESKAYGYTLSIWGSGAFLTTWYGSLTPAWIASYILGGVIGFAILATIAFHGVWKSVRHRQIDTYIVASMIHILASFGNVLISYGLIFLLAPKLRSWQVFLLIGIHASLSYNLLLLLENYLSEYIVKAEARITEEVGPT